MAEAPADMYRPADTGTGASRTILMLTADQTEDLEFFYPYYRFTEAGYRVDVVTPSGGAFKGKQGLGLKETMKIADVDPSTYDMLYIPGGKAPAALKKDENALALTRAFIETGKPVGSICHGPQLLAAAGVIKGRRIAAWPEVEGEVSAAGATYVNEATVTDGQFTTARWPADLPVQMKAIIAVLDKAKSGPMRSAA